MVWRLTDVALTQSEIRGQMTDMNSRNPVVIAFRVKVCMCVCVGGAFATWGIKLLSVIVFCSVTTTLLPPCFHHQIHPV